MGRGWSKTVRSVQIKDGHCHGVYLETYSNEFLDGEAPILAHGRWLVDGSRNTFAEEDDSVFFLFDKYKITFDFSLDTIAKGEYFYVYPGQGDTVS